MENFIIENKKHPTGVLSIIILQYTGHLLYPLFDLHFRLRKQYQVLVLSGISPL